MYISYRSEDVYGPRIFGQISSATPVKPHRISYLWPLLRNLARAQNKAGFECAHLSLTNEGERDYEASSSWLFLPYTGIRSTLLPILAILGEYRLVE